jgi:hypothetical protein
MDHVDSQNYNTFFFLDHQNLLNQTRPDVLYLFVLLLTSLYRLGNQMEEKKNTA